MNIRAILKEKDQIAVSQIGQIQFLLAACFESSESIEISCKLAKIKLQGGLMTATLKFRGGIRAFIFYFL